MLDRGEERERDAFVGFAFWVIWGEGVDGWPRQVRSWGDDGGRGGWTRRRARARFSTPPMRENNIMFRYGGCKYCVSG